MGKFNRILIEKYGIKINEHNYKKEIFNMFDDDKLTHDYFSKYWHNNKKSLHLDWGVKMLLFILTYNDNEMDNLEKLYYALSEYPDNSYIYSCMVEFYGRYNGDFFKSKKFALKSVSLNEKNPHIYYELGYIYNLIGIVKKSKEYYNKAIFYAGVDKSFDELKSRSYYNLAFYEYHLGNEKKSKELVEKSLKIMPDYPQAVQLLKMLNFSSINKDTIKTLIGNLRKIVRS